MANAIITFKIMPEDPSADLKKIEEEAKKIAQENGSMGDLLIQEEPIAFGLKAVIIKAMYEVKDDNDFDGIAEKMQKIGNVQSAEVAGMDLPLG